MTTIGEPSLARNVAHLTVATLASNACLFFGNVIILAAYGQRDHGRIMRHVAVIYLATHLAGLITSKAGVLVIARTRARAPRELGSTIVTLLAVQAAVTLALASALAVLGPRLVAIKADADVALLQLGAMWIVFNSVAQMAAMLATGLERMACLTIINPSAEVFKFIFAAVCAVMGLSIETLLLGWTAAYAISAMIGLWFVGRLLAGVDLRLRHGLAGMRHGLRLLWQAMPYFVPVLGVFAPPLVLQIAMGAGESPATAPQSVAGPNTQVSMFQFCFQLAMISRMFSLSVATALFPRLANLDAAGRRDLPARPAQPAQTRNRQAPPDRMAAIVISAERLLAVAGTLVFAAMACGAEPLLARRALYGVHASLALATLLILCLAIAMDNIAQQLDQLLSATRHAGFVAWMELVKYVVIGAIAAVAMSLWPQAAAPAAAAAVTAGTLVTLLLKLAMARRKFPVAAGGATARMMLLFAVLAAASLHPVGRWAQLPIWLIGVVALRLVSRADAAQWAHHLRRVLNRPASLGGRQHES